MSSRNVKKFKRTYNIASTTWANGTLSVTTTVTHYLQNGDSVYLIFNNTPQFLTGTVSNVAATTFDIACPANYGIGAGATVNIEYFSTNLAATTVASGVLDSVLTNTKSAFGDTVVQAVLAASGNVALKLQGSLDGINFVDISGATITITGATSGSTTISARWLFIRPVITTTATQNLTILMTV